MGRSYLEENMGNSSLVEYMTNKRLGVGMGKS
jgi:hypothetical protein